MGIGNTTVAAAVCATLFGGDASGWTGRGTGVDDDGLSRKVAAVEAASKRVGGLGLAPLEVLREVGGAELVAIAAAVVEARRRSIPVVLDGFVVGAAVASLHVARPGALDHCLAGHRSAEPGHALLLERLGLDPLVDLGLRLGEGSGALVAVPIVRLAAARGDRRRDVRGMGARMSAPVSRVARVSGLGSSAWPCSSSRGIPVRVRFEPGDLQRAVGVFPLVGALVATIGIGVRWSLEPWLGTPLATIGALTAMVLATGAFHEDGFADAADGLWGGRTPEERLRIMRDSRLGTYGTVALVLLFATKLAALVPMSLGAFAKTLVPAMVLGRASSLVLMRAIAPAPGSLATLAGPPSTAGWMVAGLTCAIVVGRLRATRVAAGRSRRPRHARRDRDRPQQGGRRQRRPARRREPARRSRGLARGGRRLRDALNGRAWPRLGVQGPSRGPSSPASPCRNRSISDASSSPDGTCSSPAIVSRRSRYSRASSSEPTAVSRR